MNMSEATSTEQATSRPALLRGWRPWAIGGAVLLCGWFLFGRGGKKDPAANGAGRPVPVAVAQARKGDMAVHLTGLGTVTAMNSVTVKSRVDGQLVRIDFTEGQMVKEGQLLAEIDPRPFQVQLMQAEGQYAKDQAAFQNAAADLRRLQGLVQQGIISRQQLDTQSSAVTQFEAALKSDQAQVESAKLNLVYSRITAPIAGRVGLRLVDAGNMIRATDANGLATIAPVQPINVVFAVPADSIQKVLGQSAKGGKLPVEAWDRDLKSRLALGSLSAIDNQVDTTTGTVRLKALFANEDRILFPNQFVNAQLLVDTLKGVVIVPTAAIQRGPQGAFLYVVKADSTVDLRIIEVQGTDGDESAVVKGLAGGETIVIDGLEKLRPGSKVALPKPPAAKG
ncbi:MdtA/MuxA family multidrug efflux RND transporter periplasmic adaptor subunit [Geothrix sp.]|uniref:MdtA/MuxA family multidrug efflux RND transporter periplasmic adaptor subunit n=1 Tax=Geothrix sp. TaxID=1962974 RepID=UPI0025C145F2|nr:MdtA/MuxA family multidrug efflux RND transporter periplasmic adaptor subunit [Geothrix sp.]WIL19926.1 MAG: MdtA/MuxA family multidrug efflux RND transporter periplasmic adaptor subunit [Geothrix sp.]